MSTKLWIDGEHGVGDAGFLVRISNPVKGSDRYELRNRPPTTNQSHQPRARGWCGTWNDTATHGCGVWKVVRVAKNGRVQLVEITDRSALVAFLDEHGFPDLLDECLEQHEASTT